MWTTIILGAVILIALSAAGAAIWKAANRKAEIDLAHKEEAARADKKVTDAAMAGKSHAELDEKLRRQREEFDKIGDRR